MADDLDLAVALDCTGSMGSYIAQAKQNIFSIVTRLTCRGGGDISRQVRLALVRYRDHPPQDESYVTQLVDFTDVTGMKMALDATGADGGGDTPEAVADALYHVTRLSWRERASKICVLIADAPPHGLDPGSGDGFPNGCPVGHDPMRIANDLAERGISIYVIGVEPSICQWVDFFMALTKMSGGLYIPLHNAAQLADAIVGAAEEELSMATIRAEMEVILDEEMKKDDADEELVAKVVWERLEGRKTKHLNIDGDALPKVSARAKRFARFDNLPDVKLKFQRNTESRSQVGSVSFRVEEKEIDMPQLQRILQKLLMMKGLR